MAAAEVIFLEQARRARDRVVRLRTIARGINAPDVLAHIEALACEMDESADQLERSAIGLVHTAGRTGDLTEDIRATIEQSKVLVRRVRQKLGDKETD
jgi:hypothetical protein